MSALPDDHVDDEYPDANAVRAGFGRADDDVLAGATDFDPENTAGASEPPSAPSYWAVSRTPLTSLVFSLPLVLAYEGGVLWLGRGTPRNGADVWLRQLLDACGFGAYFLLPAVTILGLLAWHHVEHDRWHFSPAVLLGMAGECVLWAVALVGIARLQQQLWPLDFQSMAVWPLAAASGPPAGLLEGALARIIGYCGAGLYEEVLFRLLLLPAVAWLLGRLGSGPITAAVWAILITSTLFSLAHYVGPLGDTFELYSFSFRLAAGVFFSVVFLLRGFGIAAGTHAFYDLLVGLL
ncbi:MAG: CPBP family intramembrane glutamic endopeptidase [Pirellulales bacterium]